MALMRVWWFRARLWLRDLFHGNRCLLCARRAPTRASDLAYWTRHTCTDGKQRWLCPLCWQTET
jgi:hypothetical protein